MWEDEQNTEGGRWLFQINKSVNSSKINNYWLELLLAVIGEQVSYFRFLKQFIFQLLEKMVN